MLLRPTPSRANHDGFTLIELLVVMIIIAILMAVAVPTFLSQKSTATKTKAIANIKQVVRAIESCSNMKNTDGSYDGCADHRDVWPTDKGLNALQQAGVGENYVETTPNVFDVDGITGAGRVLENGVDPTGTPVQGFSVTTWFRDGDKQLWFAEVHRPDGTVIKACGAGDSDNNRTLLTGAFTPKPVAGSRVCTTGTWG